MASAIKKVVAANTGINRQRVTKAARQKARRDARSAFKGRG